MLKKLLLVGGFTIAATGHSEAQTQASPTSFYWCEPMKAYFPYVRDCPVQWREVPYSAVYPSPAPAPRPTPPAALGPIVIAPAVSSATAPTVTPAPTLQQSPKPVALTPQPTPPTARVLEMPAPPTAPLAKQGVEQEADFVNAVEQSRTDFKAAPNEMAGGGVRFQRKDKVCAVLGGDRIDGWKGKIHRLTSSPDGRGVLEVEISNHIVVKTLNNQLSDSLSKAPTLISPGTPVFQAVSAMKEGDVVMFSGSFLPGEADCIEEGSLTLSGSMTEPEFIFHFSSVAK